MLSAPSRASIGDGALVDGGVDGRDDVVGQLVGELRRRDVGVDAGGVAHGLGVADERRLERRGPRDLGRGVEPRAVGRRDVADHGARELGQDLDLAGGRVGQLGALAQLGVVDGQGDPGRGVEDRLDHRRVAVEGLLAELAVVGDVPHGHGGDVGVDVGAELVELVELVEDGAVGGRDRPALGLDQLAELHDGLVGVGPRLLVALDHHGHRARVPHQVDAGPRALVLQRGDEARRTGGRDGQVGLLAHLAPVVDRLDHLEHRHHTEGEQRDGQGGSELQADGYAAQGRSPGSNRSPSSFVATIIARSRGVPAQPRAVFHWQLGGALDRAPRRQRMCALACALATRLSSSVSRTIFTESLLRASQSTIGVSPATPSASRISFVG